jgi:hypothetical protein
MLDPKAWLLPEKSFFVLTPEKIDLFGLRQPL